MRNLTATLGSMGLLSLVFTLLILARLSDKLGAVTKMPKYYRGFYVASALLLVAALVRFLKANLLFAALPQTGLAFLNSDVVSLLFYHIPLALSSTIGLVITWRYWGWLLKERD